MSRFEAINLGCRRGGREVFRDLVFRLDGGEALVLRGANGSGKSSLLRVLAGLTGPSAGRLTWNGEDVAEEPDDHRARLLYLGHADPMKPVLTARENLGFWVGLAGGSPKDAIEPALEALDIAHLADLPAQFLSAGQRRRLNLARLIAIDRPLWLLDEPTTALDAASTRLVAGLLARHVTSGGMVIASTHLELGLSAERPLNLDAFAARNLGAGA